MPVPVHDLETSDRSLSKLSRALSKLSLRAEARKGQLKSPRSLTQSAQNSPWSVPVPSGLDPRRARDYKNSTSTTSNGRPFLPQVSEIIPNRVFISDRYTGTDAAVLTKLRITHVVSVVSASTRIDRPLDGIRYHDMVVPHDNLKVCCSLAQIDDAVDFVDGALRKDDTRVLIHCNAGVDWSPSVAIAWLMRNENCTYEMGKVIVKQKREVANPGLEVEKSVREWWSLEAARPLFPPGRGGRKKISETFAPNYTIKVDLLNDEPLGEVIDIK